MKVIGKILKILGILLLALVLLLAAADAAWIYVPQIKAAKRIDDVDAYAAPVEALTVREGAGIIALGEATHGNAEFQRLRRDVLERLTEEYGVRSFARESAQGRGAIMISGHDGHVAAKAPYYTPMGAHLKERFGDGYFVIGTDFFKTRCNINSSDGTGRGNHSFCSADPLAAQAKRLGGSYYLDFAGVSEGGETYTLLHSAMTMGSLGEGYTFLMKLLPQSYRTADIPAELYDAMIFVYGASPITLTE